MRKNEFKEAQIVAILKDGVETIIFRPGDLAFP